MNIAKLHRLFLQCEGVSTDTRSSTKDRLFFCLSGSNFNGNTFAQKALDAGAAYAIFDDKTFDPKQSNAFFVEDSLKALQELANYHRRQFDIPVIGLTGSNGKTTTKELIKSVLEQDYNVLATEGNLNNHIGVPLTLLKISSATEIALIEMGANHLNEIAFLAELAAPTLGYITNFGKAHLEGFGSLEGVVKGKCELYDYLKKNKGTAFINGNDTKQLEQSEGLDRVSFGTSKNEDICLSNSMDKNGLCCVAIKKTKITSNLTGEYNLDNLNAAVSFGTHFKLSLASIKKGITAYQPNNNRSQWMITAHNKLLLDAYNANPSSMMAALKAFSSIEAKQKMVILGDMLELGEYTQQEHQNIVDFLIASKLKQAILVGPAFYATKAKGYFCFQTTQEAAKHLKKKALKHHTILIKGSRGIALEQLLPLL